MDLDECKLLCSYKDEEELEKVVELIGDKIIFKGYQECEVITLVELLLNIDILSLKYSARELILNTLCDAVAYYDIYSKINWEKIQQIRDDVEDDLKEYIDDFLTKK